MSLVAATGIPSPSEGVWYLGPLPLRAYGIIIAIGMVVGVWWTARRYVARGGSSDTIYDVALWAIPLGVVGARLYHVVTSPEAYFGPGGDPMLAFQIWRGGLGIWGGVALGALGAYVGVKRAKVRFGPIADSLPWGLQIDAAHVPAGYPVGTLFHPTFLYESLWDLAGAALIVALERRRRFAAGQLFGMYLMVYTAGRAWIEMLRIDDAHTVAGLRLNVWTSLAVFLLGVVLFVVAGRLGRSREVAGDGAVTDDDEREEEHSEASDSDAEDIIETRVGEDESAEESSLEDF